MDIFRIASKYCSDEKVQLMLSNAPHQIICSVDGYVFFREDEVTVHRYLDDKIRNKMPYRNKPMSDNHVNHLFEYDKLYIKITSDRNMGRGFCLSSGCYSFNLMYFTRCENGDAIGSEIPMSYFKFKDKKVKYYTTEQLNDFLRGLNGLKCKIIYEDQFGIRYAKHINEDLFIDNKFIDISEAGIIDNYNKEKEMESIPLFDTERRERLLKERPWEISDVNQIDEEFVLTYHGMLSDRDPIMITINNSNEIEIYTFKVAFCKRDCFRVETKRIPVLFGVRELMAACANRDSVSYTSEPHFD